MRRLLTLPLGGDEIAVTLDGEPDRARAGLLMVTGGTQSRIGSHRLYERLAFLLAAEGICCLRYDRRGVGDSKGEDRGFADAEADLEAAAHRLREFAPQVPLYGFGLCDGATALALNGGKAGLAGLLLANPWLVEAEAGEPAPAAIRDHYRRQLSSVKGWKALLSGKTSYRKLLEGIRKIAQKVPPSSLSARAAAGLSDARVPATILLARRDATAATAAAELRGPGFAGLPITVLSLDSASHTFAGEGELAWLAAALREAMLGKAA